MATESKQGTRARTGNEALVGVGTGSAVGDTLVRGSETARLEHLALVLDQDCISSDNVSMNP